MVEGEYEGLSDSTKKGGFKVHPWLEGHISLNRV